MMKKQAHSALTMSLVAVLLVLVTACVRSKPTETVTPSPTPTEVSKPAPASYPAPTPSEAVSEVLSRAATITSIKYDQVISPPGQPVMTQKMWLKGSKMRIEVTVSGQATVIILNFDTQMVYTYIPAQNMATKADLPQGSRTMMSLSAMEWSKALLGYPSTVVLGTEAIEGKVCLVVESGTENVKELKTWIWKEYGIPVRMERTITEGKMIIEWKGIEFGEIPDSIFELPPGVQIR